VAIEITEEMKTLVNQALADKYPCILGTASLNGTSQPFLQGERHGFLH